MKSGHDLFKQIIIDNNDVNIDTIDANDGKYQLNPGQTSANVEFIYKDIIDTIPINVFNNIKELIKIALPPEIIHIDNDAFTGSGITQECINQIKQINPFAYTDMTENVYYFGLIDENQINQDYINNLELNLTEKPTSRIQLLKGYNLLIVPESWGVPTIADDASFTFTFIPYIAEDINIENPKDKLVLIFEAGANKLAYIKWE